MGRPVMPSTERDRELIAHLTAERAGLCKSEVTRVRRLAAADEACLLSDMPTYGTLLDRLSA
jgi:hypothetical protein